MTNNSPATARVSQRRWWRSPVTWGITTAFIVAAIPFLITPHRQVLLLALLLALAGINLTLLVDPLIRVNNLEENAIDALHELHSSMSMLDMPPSLLRFSRELADDWRILEANGGPYREALLMAYVQEAKSRIHSIAQGKHEHGISDPINFRAAPLDMFTSLTTLSAANLEYWNQPHGREYLERQRSAIGTGKLTVERIIVLNPDHLASTAIESAVRRQVDAGITVLIIMRNEIPQALQSYLADDFAIATDIRQAQMLVKPISTEREVISFSPDDIAEYENLYSELRKYSRNAARFRWELPEADPTGQIR